MRWFDKEWWAYLFKPRVDKSISMLAVMKCRMQGHPCGVVWYNYSASEPDYTCKFCGDK
jgi:hypothetical protein